MEVKRLKKDKIKNFIKYCKKHRNEVDESFLYDEDLNDFSPNDENPTYIVTDKLGNIKAVTSLIIDDYHKRGKRARFRIFHSEINDISYYNMLLKAILKHREGLDNYFIFIPLTNKKLIKSIEELKFTVERYSFLLLRRDLDVSEYSFPKDYEIRAFRPGIDEEIYCEIRNKAFKKLKGNETPITPEMVSKITEDKHYIEGGLMILYHKDKPIGLIRLAVDDEYENEPTINIGPFAIIPEYQNKGLGRNLLRASLKFAKDKSYKKTILCVNAENERAKTLYTQEGFKQVEGVICYKYNLKNFK
ncbi:MAG: GNAT family N-acetyltransferase [Firmicutes bacterium]|nr:GNAT family N-acetyltransferase [Bacillota bacterium]